VPVIAPVIGRAEKDMMDGATDGKSERTAVFGEMLPPPVPGFITETGRVAVPPVLTVVLPVLAPTLLFIGREDGIPDGATEGKSERRPFREGVGILPPLPAPGLPPKGLPVKYPLPVISPPPPYIVPPVPVK
jgi:hypothetical protein